MFNQYTWKNRDVQFPNRRQLTDADSGDITIQTVRRSEGDIYDEGDPFSAERMNDLETRIKAECDAIEAAIASAQSSSIASRAFSVGQYLVYNGNFYKVTRAIASGATISPGTNCSQTTVGNELTALQNSLTSQTSRFNNFQTSVNNQLTNINTSLSGKPTMISFETTLTFNNQGLATYTKDLRQYTARTQAYFPVLVTGIETGDGVACSITDAHTERYTIAIQRIWGSSATRKALITYFIF